MASQGRGGSSASWGSGGRGGAARAGVGRLAAVHRVVGLPDEQGDQGSVSESDSSPAVVSLLVEPAPPPRLARLPPRLASQAGAAAASVSQASHHEERRAGAVRRRPARRDSEGPPVLVALVGVEGSRWSGLQAPDAAGQLQGALRCQQDAHDGSGAKLLGFAVLRSWRPMGRPRSPTRSCLRAALASEHRRCGSCFFLEHEVLRCCALQTPVLVDCAVSGSAASRQAAQLAEQHGDAAARLQGQSLRVSDILAMWRSAFDMPESMFVWPAAPLFAAGLASGVIRHDISIVLRRNAKGAWVAPLQPSRRLRQELLASASSAAVSKAEAGQQLRSVRPRVRSLMSGPESFTVEELLASVRDSRHLKSQDKSRETAYLVMKNPLSGAAAAGLDIEQPDRLRPGGPTLRRARKRLDVAAMLYHREWYVANGPFFRYIACDASPQVGQSFEVFVTVERTVRREALLGKTAASVSGQEFSSRSLPLVTLGCGKSGLNDKVSAHIHQVFLDYGPSVQHVAAACNDVRQVMSDMGTEFGIANFGQAIGQVLGEKFQWPVDFSPWKLEESEQAGRVPFLYPFALQTPGLLHIVDWIIRSTVQQLPWWPLWQAQCKRLLQFCHGQAHRDRLQALFQELASFGQADSSLELATIRFAEWRWKTLSRAVKDVARIENVMRFLAESLDKFAQQLGCRDTSAMKDMQATCRGPVFWNRSKVIGQLIEPLVSFMSWLQGCDCHEEQLLAGQSVACPFKGCRARKLSDRLCLLGSQLQALRQSLPSQDLTERNTVALAISHCLASVQLKFMWVNELPYLVWQARPG